MCNDLLTNKEITMQVYYNAEGFILLELDGAALELNRQEAEQLFVDLGHALQDHDVTREEMEINDG